MYACRSGSLEGVTIIKCDCLYYNLTTTVCYGINFKMHSNDKNQGFEKETKINNSYQHCIFLLSPFLLSYE